MPKRLCPFENDVSRQMKFHISQKVIDSSSKEYIEKVYSKTIEKLFNGAKVNNNIVSKNKEDDKKSVIPTQLKTCIKCNKTENVGKCWYCDKAYCCDCLFKCYACQEDFCNSCSVIR